VDVDKVRSLNIVPESLDNLIVPEMHFQLQGSVLEVKDLALLDILATAKWERPVYVTPTALSQFNVDFTPYVVREGNTYRILPVLNPNPDNELVNTKAAYANMVKKFQFRGLDDPAVYNSDDYRRAVQNHRNNFNALASALLMEGDTLKARNVLLHSLEKMPDRGVRYDVTALQGIGLLFEVGEKTRALEITDTLGERADQLVGYYLKTGTYSRDFRLQLAILGELARICYVNHEFELGKSLEEKYNGYADAFEVRRSEM
jgi:hypothetical protein